MHAIEVSHLFKQFGSINALNDVNFSVSEGETFGFLGPNGAGKTTTVRILTGMSVPTSGSAKIFGKDIITEKIAARKEIGIVHETSNVYDDLTAWQNLMFSGELYAVPKKEREQKGKKLLELFELWDRRSDRVHGFSKGMKRRLTLAMGLINSPRLLFLDEPTSGLDVQSNLIIREVITDLNTKGVTVFLTTHNLEEANLVCDNVAIVNKGHIAAIDSPERLKKTIESVQSIVVGFDHTNSSLIGMIKQIPQVNDFRKEGDKFRLFTEDPSSVITSMVKSANDNNIRILHLATYNPSLEDVFIKLTGLDVSSKGLTAVD